MEEAIKEDAPEWKEAFISELQSVKDANMYKIVETPRGRKVIQSRWVLRNIAKLV